jgi:tetratricopeptide (TPR) repeat protein
MGLRRFPEARRKIDQVLDITPEDVNMIAWKAAIAQAEGDLPTAAALLAPLHASADDPIALFLQANQAILERRPSAIIPQLMEMLANPNPALGSTNAEFRLLLGQVQELAGDNAAAQETWRKARSELELFLKEQPEDWVLIEDLAITNAFLGDKTVALNLAERAITANPIEKDASASPDAIQTLSRVAARVGERDRAIAALQKLLSIPGGSGIPVTRALLRLDPMFDSLRNDSRFQKLASGEVSTK